MHVKRGKILPLSNTLINHNAEGIFRKPLNRLKILCMHHKSTIASDDVIDARF